MSKHVNGQCRQQDQTKVGKVGQCQEKLGTCKSVNTLCFDADDQGKHWAELGNDQKSWEKLIKLQKCWETLGKVRQMWES